MNRSYCPNCHKANVATRYSKKTGRPYLANVAQYDHASYFRSLHTREECADEKARFDAEVAADIAKAEYMAADQAWFEIAEKVMDEFGYGSPEVVAHIEANPRPQRP